jgi:hypothetical protein
LDTSPIPVAVTVTVTLAVPGILPVNVLVRLPLVTSTIDVLSLFHSTMYGPAGVGCKVALICADFVSVPLASSVSIYGPEPPKLMPPLSLEIIIVSFSSDTFSSPNGNF